MATTFGKARDAYPHQAAIKSQHTLDAYLRAIDLFLVYLDDRHFSPQLPIQKQPAAAEELTIDALSGEDEAILKCFARWLQTPGSDRRPYAQSTVELRMAGILRWFEFIASKGWLPSDFSLENATKLLKEHLIALHTDEPADKSVEIEHDLSMLVDYYASQNPPRNLRKNPDQLHRWELTRLRNHALLQTLAETGGQVSAILDLNLGDVMTEQKPLKIDVVGKGEHSYQIALDTSLPALYAYLSARAISPDADKSNPVFVSHDSNYDGHRMSRVIAWRIVQRAAQAVGLPKVSPHDLRHWRAQQLINAGATAQEVRQKLGHRSSHTINVYYGHLFEERDRSTSDD